MAIPKIIHYCWLGDKPLPENAKKCIRSWKKYCPDYEIRRWTEKDFDLNINTYTKQASEAKAWAFASDYIRLWIIYNYGGIYLDTDVQIIKNFDPLLNNTAFAGTEDTKFVALGLGFGAEAGNKIIAEHMQQYNDLVFTYEDGTYNKTPIPYYTTEVLKKHGFIPGKKEIQRLDNILIYPPEYFCPKDFETGITKLTKNTFSIHHFDASWYSEDEQAKKNKRWKAAKKDFILHIPNRLLRNIFGDKMYVRLKHLLKK